VAAGFDAAPKRFYKAVDIRPVQGGFAVRLDGRVPKSPRLAPLVLPTAALARRVAAEWEGQGETILLSGMTSTRRAFTAIDQVPPSRAQVADEIARYAGSDVLCYMAEAPASLAERQGRAWLPILDWAEKDLNLSFVQTRGIVHLPQRNETLDGVRALALAADDMALTALADATALFGSAILALALQRGRLDGASALDLSRLDEIAQIEAWGMDEEASARIADHHLQAQDLQGWFEGLA